MATNQGPSSTQDNEIKKPYQMATPENTAGNESGPTNLIPTSDHTVPYSGNDLGINISASPENLSAKYKYPRMSQDEGAGANQY